MRIAIELRANDNDFKGLQYISGQVNAIIQSAVSISDLQSFNSGPTGVGYTIDMTQNLVAQINDLQARAEALNAELPIATQVVLTPILSTNPIPAISGVS